MSSNFDSYLTPSTSLGALAGQSDNVTDDDDSDSKNSQSYKERRFVWEVLSGMLTGGVLQTGSSHRCGAEEERRHQERLRLSAGAGAAVPADGPVRPQGQQGRRTPEVHWLHPTPRQPEEEAGVRAELPQEGGWSRVLTDVCKPQLVIPGRCSSNHESQLWAACEGSPESAPGPRGSGSWRGQVSGLVL